MTWIQPRDTEPKRLLKHTDRKRDTRIPEPILRSKKKVKKTYDERFGDGTEGSGHRAHLKKALEHYEEKTGYSNPGSNPEVKEKVKKTIAEQYGDGDYEQANKNLYQHRAKSYKEKTGYENPGENPEVKEKVRKTVKKKYGVINVFQDTKVKQKSKKTMIKHYGVPYNMQSDEIMEEVRKTNLEKYNVPYVIMRNEIRKSSGVMSKRNQRFREFLENSLNCEVELEYPFDSEHRMAADLHIIGTNILIDINPTISHNIDIAYPCFKNICKGSKTGDHSLCKPPMSRDYHQHRALVAKSNGYELIQLYNWDRDDMVLDLLKRELEIEDTKYDASALDIGPVTPSDADMFIQENSLDINHLPVPLNDHPSDDGTIIGLYHDKELVQLMVCTPCDSQNSNSPEWTIGTVLTRNGVTVNGGFGRLLTQFLHDSNPASVAYNVDFNKYSTVPEDMVEVGFHDTGITSPVVYWAKCQHDSPEHMVCDEQLDDLEDALSSGLVRVCDAGRIKCLWTRA